VSRSVNLAGGIYTGLVVDNGAARSVNVSGGVFLTETGIAAYSASVAESAAIADRFGYPADVALAETVAVTSDTFIAKPPTGAIVPGAEGECALFVTVPGFDDDVTGYRVTMPGGPRVTMAGDLRVSMAGAVRLTIPDETGAFRVTTAGNKRITLQ